METGDHHPDFLGHLPPAASFCLVEINMAGFVAPKTLAKFAQQLLKREKNRKKKFEREERYFGKVDKHQDKMFEDLKKQAFGYVSK